MSLRPVTFESCDGLHAGAMLHLLQVLLIGQVALVAANFHEGEFVPTARRGQFHGVSYSWLFNGAAQMFIVPTHFVVQSRTVWHDLLGRHCPRFARETKVAIPIPQPKGFKAIHLNYKIQFAFDGDRILTAWVPIIGKYCPKAPVLHIELEHRDSVLTSAKAEIRPVSSEYLREHQQLLQEFRNATHWPKHLLVHYTWKHTNPVNAVAGLYLIFASGIIVTAALGLSVLISYQDKLEAFLADLAADDLQTAGPAASTWGQPVMTHKAD